MSQIPHDEYASRRKRVLQRFENAVGLVFAGDAPDDEHQPFRPHPHFHYLTGVVDEPSAVLLLDPNNPVERRREMLFLRPLNPEVEKWDGYRDTISGTLRQQVGIQTIYRTNQLPRFFTAAAVRSKRLACLHPLAAYNQPLSPDLKLFRNAAERIPGCAIVDASNIITQLRSVKSEGEVAVIQQAIDITATAFDAVCKGAQPGMSEFELQEVLEHAYRTNGSRGPAFPSIVGSGLRSTVLHYRDNNQMIDDGDLICIDSGAALGGYGADVTRTIPANGKFTGRQREVYEIVLHALEAALKAVRPGMHLAELDQVARNVITTAGYGDAFIHSIGHHLGLETHDATPDGPLQPGNVITIEPGIYLPDEKIGVRIEDDVLITQKGSRNLSEHIPKSVEAIEQAMAR